MASGTRGKKTNSDELAEVTSPTSVVEKVDSPTAKRNLAADVVLEQNTPDKRKKNDNVEARGSNPYKKNDATGRKITNDEHIVFVSVRGPEVVKHGEDADQFRSDWNGCIISSKSFPSKQDAEAFAESLVPTPPATPIKKEPTEVAVPPLPLTPSSQATLTKVLAALKEKKPGNRFNMHFRTNCASSAAVVLMDFLNISGKNQWNVKPDLLAEPIRMFANEFSDDILSEPIIACVIMGHLFNNIKIYRLRDMSAGVDVPLQTTWRSPDKTKEIVYDQYILGTSFPIPVDELKSESEETAFITAKLQQFGAVLKKVLLSPLFAQLHEAKCPKESIWKSMNGQGPKKGGLTFLEYINSAVISVNKCDNLNSHVVLSDANELMTILWDARSKGSSKKY